jgi:pectin methylesterase-like acyl-CoA thioesterase
MTRLLLVAAVVVVLAAAGAGATCDVHQGDSIQTAIDGAGGRDTIYVHAGTYVENVDVWNRVTLIGDSADVVTGSSVIPRPGRPIESYPARI